jgi:DNA-directed RNA polymerase sigma subunit (sigma70/sigma32)
MTPKFLYLAHLRKILSIKKHYRNGAVIMLSETGKMCNLIKNGQKMERETGFEPATFALARQRSTS